MNKQPISVQDVFLNRVRKENIPITIHVVNGFQIKNALVKSYDSFVLLVEAEGKQMMLYKHAISTITPAKSVDMQPVKNKDTVTEEENAQ